MKKRVLVRLVLALALATTIPACHHHVRKSAAPPPQESEQPDPNAPAQKP